MKKNYKASYAAMVYDTFKRIIKYAIKEDVLYRDVTDNDDKKIQVTRSKVAFWTKDKMKKFCRPSTWAILINIWDLL